MARFEKATKQSIKIYPHHWLNKQLHGAAKQKNKSYGQQPTKLH